MMSISDQQNNSRFILALLLAAEALLLPAGLLAQETQSLSVSPTLFEMTASPTQVWRSSVKVANTNAYPLTIYARVVNFAPQGEGGTGKFIPVFEDFTDGTTLAEWIDITDEPVVAPRESNIDIPFMVTVPEDATPGGHFAAILIGTEPPKTDEPVQVRTSQVVTSLFFVRISGDVIEKGDIREFRVVDRFLTEPAADLELRFENKGNVHLQPQGQISLYNMWGEERGVIPINHETNFGNVLPESIRLFRFSWEGAQSLTDIGRFKAVATLGYGEDGRKFVTRATTFWVVPLQEVAITAGALFLIFFIVSRIIKLYIRRMLILSGIDPDAPRRPRRGHPVARGGRDGDVTIGAYQQLTAPMRSGMRDLFARLRSVETAGQMLLMVGSFILVYRYFFLSLLALAGISGTLWWYVDEAKEDERLYEVTIATGDRDVVVSSEEVHYPRAYDAPGQPVASSLSSATTSQLVPVSLVNVSGVPGAVADLRRTLEGEEYEVISSEVDLERTERRSVIVFSLDRQEEAVTLSKALGGILLSAGPATSTDTLTIFVGEDLAF